MFTCRILWSRFATECLPFFTSGTVCSTLRSDSKPIHSGHEIFLTFWHLTSPQALRKLVHDILKKKNNLQYNYFSACAITTDWRRMTNNNTPVFRVKMETFRSAETVVTTCKGTRCHNQNTDVDIFDVREARLRLMYLFPLQCIVLAVSVRCLF
jgi:hypothetical protein